MVGLMRGLGSLRRASTAVAAATSTSLEALEARPSTFVTTLDSGLRVASQRTGHRTGTVGVYIEAGARFETLPHFGCSNMLQHMLFKGGTAKRSGPELCEALASSGVRVAQDADREIVSASAHCLASELGSAVSLIGEAISQPKFSESAIDEEKDLVFRRTQARNNQYQDVTMDLLHKAAFQGTPLENGLFGYSTSLEGMRASDVASFHRSYYLAPRTVVVGVGPWDHAQLVALAKEAFAPLHTTPEMAVAYEGPCRFTSAALRYEDDTFPACFEAVALEGLPYGHPDHAVLDVIAAITGSFDRARDPIGPHILPYLNDLDFNENGRIPYRTYQFDFFNIAYKESGFFGGYWAVDECGYMAQNVVKSFLTYHLVRMAMGATDTEVRMGRELAKTRFLKAATASGSGATAASIGREILYTGDRRLLADRYAAIEAVTTADVMRVMQELVWDKDTAFAAVGQIEGSFCHIDAEANGPNGLTARKLA